MGAVEAGAGEMKEEQPGIETFEYAECPGIAAAPSWTGWGEVPDLRPRGAGSTRAEGTVSRDSQVAESAGRIAAETRRAFEEGRQRGMEEGRRQEQAAQAVDGAAREQDRIRRSVEMVEAFARERDRYLREVEQEVVRLAVVVAARILRREAQTDPLLAIGAVRVALGQIPAATEVRLLVPAAELDLWTEAVALLPNLTVRPKVVAAGEMQRGDCRIETALGWADLGIDAQLNEIGQEMFKDRQEPRTSLLEPVR